MFLFPSQLGFFSFAFSVFIVVVFFFSFFFFFFHTFCHVCGCEALLCSFVFPMI